MINIFLFMSINERNTTKIGKKIKLRKNETSARKVSNMFSFVTSQLLQGMFFLKGSHPNHILAKVMKISKCS